MTLLNGLLIILIIGIAIGIIYYHINSQKKAEIINEIDVDDKTYTLGKMIELVKRRLEEIPKINYMILVYLKKN